MKKLIHEEIDREVASKSVNIAMKMSKPTVQIFMKGLETVTGTSARAIGEKIHPTHGIQSVRTLVRQGQGVSSIPLADGGLKEFQKIAKKYGIDFAVIKDKTAVPPVYTVFFKAKDMDVVTKILQDYSEKQVKKSVARKMSVLGKLKKFKEIVAAIPKKVTEKKKERSL